MADLPLDRPDTKATASNTVTQVTPGKLQVTHENADLLTVHFLSKIHGRMGYLIKLIEGLKEDIKI